MKGTFETLLVALTLALLPVTATAKDARPEATSISSKYVRAGELRPGEERSVDTPYGRMTCIGGNNLAYQGGSTGRAGTRGRSCTWN